MFCDQCGKENPDNAQFCRSCGYNFGDAADRGGASASPAAQATPKKPGSLLGSFKVVAFIIEVVALVLCVFFYIPGITLVFVTSMALIVLSRPATFSGLAAVGFIMLVLALVFAIAEPGESSAVKLVMEKIVCSPGQKLISERNVTKVYQGKSVLSFPKRCEAPDGSSTKVSGGMSYVARLIFYLAVGAVVMVITTLVFFVRKAGAEPDLTQT